MAWKTLRNSHSDMSLIPLAHLSQGGITYRQIVLLKEDSMGCTPVDVEIEVITPDQKRKINFGLVKLCNDDGTITWKINFELDEKKNATDASFNEVAKVSVRIGEDDHAAAQATADQGELSDAQAAQAIAAGDTLKAHKDDPDHPDVEADVTQVLHADES
jgi:hypothetical protein